MVGLEHQAKQVEQQGAASSPHTVLQEVSTSRNTPLQVEVLNFLMFLNKSTNIFASKYMPAMSRSKSQTTDC